MKKSQPKNPFRVKPVEKKNQPAFATRKTIADYIKENLAKIGRKTFYQRVILVAKHLEEFDEQKLEKDVKAIIDKSNDNVNEERITGLYILYKNYSVVHLEGSEDCVSAFYKGLAQIERSYFEVAKILLVQNNISRVYFKSLLWHTDQPPELSDTIEDDDEEVQEEKQCDTLIEKMHTLCDLLANASPTPQQLTRSLPEIPRLVIVLRCKNLLLISEFAVMYLSDPVSADNDEKVWPAPYDYTPYGVFDISKYNVNLTFADEPK